MAAEEAARQEAVRERERQEAAARVQAHMRALEEQRRRAMQDG